MGDSVVGLVHESSYYTARLTGGMDSRVKSS